MGSSGEIMLRVVFVLDVEETRIQALELRPERVIEHPGSRLPNLKLPPVHGESGSQPTCRRSNRSRRPSR